MWHRIEAPVLVTGGCGFVGRALVARLSDARCRVVATYFREHPPVAMDGVQWVHADLRHSAVLEEVGELGAVVHLAAGLPSAGEANIAETAHNRAIDEHVIEPALRMRIPVIYASTGALYGDVAPPSGWRESGPTVPDGPYLEAKAAGESSGIALAERFDTRFTALRINAPYGPDQRGRTVVHIFIEQARAGGPITFLGSGSREQDFTYVDDVVDACCAALDGPGGIFNVAGGSPVTMRQLAEIVAGAAGLGPSAVNGAGSPDPQEHRRVAFDLRRSAELLGWSPRTALSDGISRCLRRAGR